MDENLEDSLKKLVEGHRLPQNGMEVHFLKVIKGMNSPCTAEEKQWYSWWQKYLNSPKHDVVGLKSAIPSTKQAKLDAEYNAAKIRAKARYADTRNTKAFLNPNLERLQKEKEAAIRMAAENGPKPKPIPISDKELSKLKAKGPTNYKVDEGIGGTRADNNRMRNQLWGDMVSRGRK
jgi:uncharacterized protein YifE (UPF0438 family)